MNLALSSYILVNRKGPESLMRIAWIMVDSWWRKKWRPGRYQESWEGQGDLVDREDGGRNDSYNLYVDLVNLCGNYIICKIIFCQAEPKPNLAKRDWVIMIVNKRATLQVIHNTPPKEEKQAGTELGQAQLQLELGFTLITVCCIALMITNYHYISL